MKTATKKSPIKKDVPSVKNDPIIEDTEQFKGERLQLVSFKLSHSCSGWVAKQSINWGDKTDCYIKAIVRHLNRTNEVSPPRGFGRIARRISLCARQEVFPGSKYLLKNEIPVTAADRKMLLKDAKNKELYNIALEEITIVKEIGRTVSKKKQKLSVGTTGWFPVSLIDDVRDRSSELRMAYSSFMQEGLEFYRFEEDERAGKKSLLTAPEYVTQRYDARACAEGLVVGRHMGG